MYDLTGVIDIEGLSAVDPGTSLLVAGPALSGKDDLAIDVLADGIRQGQGAVAVTTDGTVETLVSDIADRAPDGEPHQIAALDCRADGGAAELEGAAHVHRVSEPSDLTDIGIGITQGFDRLDTAGVDRGRLALTSLSTMLTYADRQTVFKFCHVLTSRLDAAGYLGVFTIDVDAHDDRTVQVLKQAFDGLVEVREGDGNRDARLTGLGAEASAWTTL